MARRGGKVSNIIRDANFYMDISGVNELMSFHEGFADKYDDFLFRFLDNIGRQAKYFVIKRTNVGKHGEIYNIKGGMLRRAWQLTPVSKQGTEYRITLYADTAIAPYALYVEEGHRTLAYSPHTGKRIYYQLPNGEWRAAKDGWTKGRHWARDSVRETMRGFRQAHDLSLAAFIKRLEQET